jgi:hypothetical protein
MKGKSSPTLSPHELYGIGTPASLHGHFIKRVSIASQDPAHNGIAAVLLLQALM